MNVTCVAGGHSGVEDDTRHLFVGVSEKILELDNLLTRETCVVPMALFASHVTRHTSHVTRHTSHVTRHTSHASRHTSHVTRHTSHVTLHSSLSFWKFHHMWRAHMQALVCMVSCLTFFSSKTIARPDHVTSVLVRHGTPSLTLDPKLIFIFIFIFIFITAAFPTTSPGPCFLQNDSAGGGGLPHRSV